MSRERPNILFLFDDQHNAGCLGYAGHPLVQTPNLDELARRGAAFNNMFACSGICCPSRTSFFTGTYVRTHGHAQNEGDLAKPLPSILTELGKAGYTRIQTGKNHLPHAVSKEFDVMWTANTHSKELHAKGLTHRPEAPWHQHFHSACWPHAEEDHRGVWTAQKTIDFLDSEEAKENPFFVWTSFAPPHSPHTPPASLDELYRPEDIPVDWDEYYRFERSKLQNRPMMEDFWKVGSVRHDITIFQKAVCRYLALITLVDREIGRVLESLRANGLADDTIVVFTADHGDFAGQYGQLGKNLPAYDDILRIPFIYCDPYTPHYGRVIEGMFQNVDLFPTLVDRLGLELPPTCQGMSFLPALEGRPNRHRQEIFAETSMEKTIRTRDWKLTFFVRHPNKGQLFQMTPEVNEIDNYWDDPQYRHVRTELMVRLMAWMAASEQPNNMCDSWEEYVDTPWYSWLAKQPEQVAYPEPPLMNEQ